jgi:hypothetical protein
VGLGNEKERESSDSDSFNVAVIFKEQSYGKRTFTDETKQTFSPNPSITDKAT